MTLEQYKEQSNKHKTRNFGFVKIAKDHLCGHCKDRIKAGTICLSSNIPRKGRKWYCDECVRLIVQIKEANNALNNIPFSDEGGAYAAMDLIKELEDEFYSRAN